jgi:transcriptional regulator with XRE-family HTH domain
MGIPFEKIEARWRKNPEYIKAVEEAEAEYQLARAMIAARVRSGLTQKEVARRMDTTQPVVARIERGAKPSWRTVERYAAATGTRAVVDFVAIERSTKPRAKAAAGRTGRRVTRRSRAASPVGAPKR